MPELVRDAESAQAWIQSGLEHVLATNELPILAILYRDVGKRKLFGVEPVQRLVSCEQRIVRVASGN